MSLMPFTRRLICEGGGKLVPCGWSLVTRHRETHDELFGRPCPNCGGGVASKPYGRTP